MTANRQQPQNGYVDILQHILLLIFTFGIYQYYWIYKTTKLLNFYSQEQRNEVTELLLCIFVPFYFIYWYYKTADIVEKVDYQNPNKDFKTLCDVAKKALEKEAKKAEKAAAKAETAEAVEA